MQKRIIAVIGGGAAGMMAAITAAGAGSHNQIVIYEGNDRVGKKILSTGNGKCNFSNLYQEPSCYRGGGAKLAYELLEEFGPKETATFFQGLGMLVKNKNGYLYPATEQASTVLDVLRMQLRDLQIKVETSSKVQVVKKDERTGKFSIQTQNGNYSADKVILATGGKAAPKTGSDGSGFKLAKDLGHQVVECVPALVQLKCSADYMKALAGVRCDASVTLEIEKEEEATQRGEVQFTEYGLSGIVVFQLSRMAAYACREKRKVKAVLDLLPDYDKEAIEDLKAGRKLLFSGRTAEEFFTGILHKKLMLQIVKLSGIKPNQQAEELTDDRIDAFFRMCKAWEFTVTGTNSFEQAQVCAGGVSMEEVDDKLESKKVKGLYFAGEILDVDGICGGYNLQWAWTSGYIAGESAGKET